MNGIGKFDLLTKNTANFPAYKIKQNIILKLSLTSMAIIYIVENENTVGS